MKVVFVAAVSVQLILGIWRARLIGTSLAPALALTIVIAVVGVLWFVKRRELTGASLANFVALLAATAGVLSAMSAANAPFIGAVARISVPLFAFSIAALLASAKQDARFVTVAAIIFLLALALLEIDLTIDAQWESQSELFDASG